MVIRHDSLNPSSISLGELLRGIAFMSLTRAYTGLFKSLASALMRSANVLRSYGGGRLTY